MIARARRPRMINKPKVRTRARAVARELKKLHKEKEALDKVLERLNEKSRKLNAKIEKRETEFNELDELYTREWPT